MAPMTRATLQERKEIWLRILTEVLEETNNGALNSSLQREGYETLDDICMMDDAEIMALEYEQPAGDDGIEVRAVPKNQRKKLLHLMWWRDWKTSQLRTRKITIESWNELTLEAFQEYREGPVVERARAASTAGARKTMAMDETTITSDQVQRFHERQKRTVDSYIPFNGSMTMWRKVDRAWKSTAQVDGLARILQIDPIAIDKDMNDAALYEAQNAWIFNMFTQRITGGQALIIIRNHEPTRNGHAAYVEMKRFYERDSNIIAIRTECQRKLANLVLTAQFPGGPTKFFHQFQNIYLDLEQATGVTVNDTEKIGTLLAAIDDPRFFSVRDALRTSAVQLQQTVTYENYLAAFITLADDLAAAKTRNMARPGRVNNTNRRTQNQRSYNNNARRDNNSTHVNRNNNRNTTYIPPHVWRTMSSEAKTAHIRRRSQNRGTGTQEQQPRQANQTTRSVSWQAPVAQEREQNERLQPEVTEETTPTIRSIMRAQSRQVNTMTGHKECAKTKEPTSMLIDSGANVSLAGNNLKLLEQGILYTDIEGFQDTLRLERKQLGTYAGLARDKHDDAYIIVLHQVAGCPGDKTILATNQARAFGVQIDDTPTIFGGQQSLTTNEDITFPLTYEDGLVYLEVQLPSEKDLATYEWLHLTADGDWPRESRQVHHVNQVKHEQLTSYLLYKPIDVVEKTLKCTTQLAKNVVRMPMRQHFKSRFPALNVPRLTETYATDTFFAHTEALSGITMVQLFVGKTSTFTAVYPMNQESQFRATLEDFIREYGAMETLFSDNAKAETSHAVRHILRMYNIKDLQSEPHMQHQNYAERRIQEVKATTRIVMDRTGTPDELWFLCMEYVVYVLNHLATPRLKDRTPIESAFGITPDISSILVFEWYQRVCYRKNDEPFPATTEQEGRFVGIATHCGDALTFKVYIPESKQIICRSVVRPATSHHNMRAETATSVEEKKPLLVSESDHIDPTRLSLPHIDPTDIIGRIFMRDINGKSYRAEVIDTVENGSASTQPYYEILVGNSTDVVSEKTLSEWLKQQETSTVEQESQDPNEQYWTFQQIRDHKKWQNQWHVLVEWDNGEETWEPLKTIRKSDPVSLAQYAQQKHILHLPGWKSLKPFVRKKDQVNIAKKRVKKKGVKYKFGHIVANNYHHALLLDKQKGCNIWMEAIQKERDQLWEYDTFYPCPENMDLNEYQRIRTHYVFDVKHDGRHRARMVADGNLTAEDTENAYSGVASLRAIRLVVFLSVLNKQRLLAADIGNAYLEATTKEKVYFIAGPEFGELEGQALIIKKALYGLRTSGARYHEHFADTLRDMGFVSCKADQDIWMKRNTTKYDYVVVYVDDLLIASDEPEKFIETLQKKGYKLKGIGPPSYYLGGNFETINGVLTWGPTTFITKILANYETLFNEPMPKRQVHAPLDPTDHPELDDSPLLDQDGRAKYMSLIGSLQWAVALGRIDITVAVITMASFRIAPREGHLNRLKRIYMFLRTYKKTSIKFRAGVPNYENVKIDTYDWTNTYYPAREELPSDMPTPLGNAVVTTSAADANLLHDRLTGRSMTGILHMINQTPIQWLSKKQATVETSTYGSEAVAARICVEQIMDLRYTLRMLGVPIHSPSIMLGDNIGVIMSTTIPKSMLKKRHNALAYHRVREAVAANVVRFIYIKSKDNPADVLTKFMSSKEWYPLMKPLLFWTSEKEEKEKQRKDKVT